MVVQSRVPQQCFLHVLARDESVGVQHTTDTPIEPLRYAIGLRRSGLR